MTATSVGAEAARRGPGRPRDAWVDAAIMQAAIDVLAERGPRGFTVDLVAARAGCGKATVYRRWPSRAALLLDAVHRMGLAPEPVDTGTVRGDLVAGLTQFATKLRETPAGRILPAVVADAAFNTEMREVLAAFLRDRRGHPREAVLRGVERGELPPSTDVDMVLDLLGGVVFYRELVSGDPADPDYVGRVVDLVLAGVSRSAAGGPRPVPGPAATG
ncbi:MAG TPA: TetR/AcrR family transcriptional regulator [Acidimicrobiales bacterium]|nr:TetR/AcrR family transcriptional regulator [Acidimicrobiales bacterium]